MARVYGQTIKTPVACAVASSQVDSNFEMKTDAIAFPSNCSPPPLRLESNGPSSSLGPLSINLKCPILLTLVETQYVIKGKRSFTKEISSEQLTATY